MIGSFWVLKIKMKIGLHNSATLSRRKAVKVVKTRKKRTFYRLIRSDGLFLCAAVREQTGTVLQRLRYFCSRKGSNACPFCL